MLGMPPVLGAGQEAAQVRPAQRAASAAPAQQPQLPHQQRAEEQAQEQAQEQLQQPLGLQVEGEVHSKQQQLVRHLLRKRWERQQAEALGRACSPVSDAPAPMAAPNGAPAPPPVAASAGAGAATAVEPGRCGDGMLQRCRSPVGNGSLSKELTAGAAEVLHACDEHGPDPRDASGQEGEEDAAGGRCALDDHSAPVGDHFVVGEVGVAPDATLPQQQPQQWQQDGLQGILPAPCMLELPPPPQPPLPGASGDPGMPAPPEPGKVACAPLEQSVVACTFKEQGKLAPVPAERGPRASIDVRTGGALGAAGQALLEAPHLEHAHLLVPAHQPSEPEPLALFGRADHLDAEPQGPVSWPQACANFGEYACARAYRCTSVLAHARVLAPLRV